MVNSWPINTTEGVLVYLQRNGYFVQPPYGLRDEYKDRTVSNDCIWVTDKEDLLDLIEEFKKAKYN